ncbi:MAG: DUF4307 domain-containing protein [Bowdeniella nasicola]|nr:DUF4307 domain-containing protein [Bowdeniella nasicola]
MADAEYLRERYGLDGRNNRLLYLLGAIAALVIGTWLVWQAISLTKPQAHASYLGADVHSDSEILIRYNVTSDKGNQVRCSVHAFNENLVEVGVKEVTTTIVTQPTTVEVMVVTTQGAAKGEVRDCEVVK